MKSPKEIVQLMMNDDTFSKWLGIEIDFIDNCTCNLKSKITAEMLNGFQIAHG
jgi:acyl-CoA thioesterase